MIFSRSWKIRRVAFALFFLMADFIFNHGITPCVSYRVQSKGNSSAGTEGIAPNDYLELVEDRSRALEEVIYSDILNNLRSLLRRPESAESAVARGKSKEEECGRRNDTGKATNLRIPTKGSKRNAFLVGAGEAGRKEGAGRGVRNVTFAVREQEYFLGYSGNPFGSRQPISGAVEVPEIEGLGRGVGDPRKKRSVLHLYNMVLCTTGCNPFAYKGYGCYCGFLGSGFVVDGIDSCCKMHDWCYNSAGCPMFLEYFIPYLWQCHHRQPLCAIDHGYYGGPGSCAQRLCECDRQLALCLRRYPCPSSKALCTSSPWRLLQNVLML